MQDYFNENQNEPQDTGKTTLYEFFRAWTREKLPSLFGQQVGLNKDVRKDITVLFWMTYYLHTKSRNYLSECIRKIEITNELQENPNFIKLLLLATKLILLSSQPETERKVLFPEDIVELMQIICKDITAVQIS